jgi:predicted Zn finger-like uncharacterized protein
MRIVCDNCGAKYQISDDKVRNKVFKIRCKRCAHVIVVRANQDVEQSAEPVVQAADEATKVVKFEGGQPVVPPPPEDAIWYVVINREQVGPLSKEQIEQHFHDGDVDGEAFTWSEGMADWTRLASVPEFASLFPAPSVATQEAEPTIGEVPGPQHFAGLDEPDDDVMASNNVSLGAEPEAHDPRVSGNEDHLRNQRNENSVLFSLDSLSAETPLVRNTGGTDGSGLIDISALAGASMSSPAADDPFGGGGGFAPVSAAPVGGAPMPSMVSRPGASTGKTALIAVLVVLFLGSAGAGAWYFLREKPVVEPVKVASNDAPAKVVMGSKKKVPDSATATVAVAPSTAATTATAAATDAGVKAEGLAAAAGSGAAAQVKVAAAPKAAKSRAKRRRSTKRTTPKRPEPITRRTNPEDKPPVRRAAPAKPPPRRKVSKGDDELDGLLGGLGKAPKRTTPAARNSGAAAAPDPMLPAKLSRAQILSVVRKNAGSIRSCSQSDPSARGTVRVKMVIGSSGRVSSARVDGPPFRDTPVGNCVESKVKRFRFPQFSSDNMRLTMPFSI